jgi:uncharacterized protein YjbI with pentapeptide repeats
MRTVLSASFIRQAFWLTTLASFGSVPSLSCASEQPERPIAQSPSVANSKQPVKPAIKAGEAASAGKTATKPKQKGVFRGDWGDGISYLKDDRVTTEDESSFLSLADDNLGYPPATSPKFWQLLTKGNLPKADDCKKLGPAAKLGKCDFTAGEKLNGAQLAGADLSKTKLSGELGSADLTGANLSHAWVQGGLTIRPETKLKKANLSGLHAGAGNELVAEGADLSETKLAQADLYNANLAHARLVKADLHGTNLTGANLAGSRFESADLSESDLSFANLNSGSLQQASLTHANLTDADLTFADLSQAKLKGAVLAGTDLTGANLFGADLQGANLESAKGADSAHIDSSTNFASAVCPDGVTVDGAAVTTCVGHGF